MSRSQLAHVYGVSLKTLRSLFKRHKKKLGHLERVRIFTPSEIKLIFNVLGEPEFYDSVKIEIN